MADEPRPARHRHAVGPPLRLRAAQVLSSALFAAGVLLVLLSGPDGPDERTGIATAALGAVSGLLVQLRVFAWEREHAGRG